MALIGGLRWSIHKLGIAIAVLTFLPGAIGLIGLRAWTARVVRSSYHVDVRRPFTIDFGFGGPDGQHMWRRVVMRLAPHTTLFLLGSSLLTPYLIQFAALSVTPFPTLLRNPSLFSGHDVGVIMATDAWGTYGLGGLFKIWVGVSCWFWAPPPYRLVRDTRHDLRALQRATGKVRWAARTLRATLGPPAILLRSLAVLDEIALWAGSNVMIATGGVCLVMLYILELTLLSWLWPNTLLA